MSFGEGYGGYGERDRTDDESPAGLTTTTRLPDSEGSGRTAPRPGRSVVTLVGIVVLLIAAIAFANQGGDDGDSADGQPSGEAQPTAPTGRKPVKSDGEIPSGFPQSKQGAESAAANYAVALGGDGMFDDAQRKKIVDAVYAPHIADQRRSALNRVYRDPKFLTKIGLKKNGEAPGNTTFISRTNPVGTKITKFGKSSATVSVWYSSLFGLAGEGSKNPVTESWYTNTFDLKWAGGDWKVNDFKQKDGPVPVGRDQTASTAKEMAEAVEGFGGFTYAR
jgi:hypothetical protein